MNNRIKSGRKSRLRNFNTTLDTARVELLLKLAEYDDCDPTTKTIQTQDKTQII